MHDIAGEPLAAALPDAATLTVTKPERRGSHFRRWQVKTATPGRTTGEATSREQASEPVRAQEHVQEEADAVQQRTIMAHIQDEQNAFGRRMHRFPQPRDLTPVSRMYLRSCK